MYELINETTGDVLYITESHQAARLIQFWLRSKGVAVAILEGG